MLMLLGYISCVVAPFLSINSSTDINQPKFVSSHKIEISNQQTFTSESESIFHFHEDFLVDEFLIQATETVLNTTFTAKLPIPESIGKSLSAFPFAVFSRPPPFFF